MGVEPSPSSIGVHWVAGTDVGLVREHNEDNFVVANLAESRAPAPGEDAAPATSGAIALAPEGAIFLVCDGMGGAAAGEVAAQLAVDTVCSHMHLASAPKDRDEFAWRLVHSLEAAGEAIFALAAADRKRRGMGTTATLAGLMDKVLFVGQVGDSRAYILRNQRLGLISKDQSLVNQLLEAGQLTESEAQAFEHSNIILQALGTAEELTVDLTFLELRRGDLLLLCSDGLSGMVPLHLMQEVLNEGIPLEEKLTRLIAYANQAGGHDNSTVVLAVFEGEGLQPPNDGAKVAYQQYPLVPVAEDIQGEPITRAGRRLRTRSLPAVSELEAEPTRPGHSRSGAVPLMSPTPPASGPRWLLPGAALAALCAVVAGAWWLGSGSPTTGPGVAVQQESDAVTPDAPRPVEVEVSMPIATSALFVDGALEGRANATGTVHTELFPGLYRFEARSGDQVLVGEVVEVPALDKLRVELLMNDPFAEDGPGGVDAEGGEPSEADPSAETVTQARSQPKASEADAPGPADSPARGTAQTASVRDAAAPGDAQRTRATPSPEAAEPSSSGRATQRSRPVEAKPAERRAPESRVPEQAPSETATDSARSPAKDADPSPKVPKVTAPLPKGSATVPATPTGPDDA